VDTSIQSLQMASKIKISACERANRGLTFPKQEIQEKKASPGLSRVIREKVREEDIPLK
jgi:hypothetical protein